MIDTPTTVLFPPATDADGKLLLAPAEAKALLRDCFAEFRAGLHELVAMSIDTTNDLFEMNELVKDSDVLDFRAKRAEWVPAFEKNLEQLFERRLGGKKRSGRRPDFDASLTTLRVLNAFDQEKQASLVLASAMVWRVTRREVGAIDLRAGVLLGETRFREADNPFSPDYVLDGIGVTCRSLYPNPRVWRPLMERILADITSGMRKVYIRVNRFLSDRHVLPEIKAELRARSEHRPADDSELLPAFLQLFKEAGPAVAETLPALNIEVPAASASASGELASLPGRLDALAKAAASGPPSLADGGQGAAPAATQSAANPDTDTNAATSASAAASAEDPPLHPLLAPLNPYAADAANPPPLEAGRPASAPASPFGLPTLDPMLALGQLSSAVAVLDRWQHVDPGDAWMAGSSATGVAAGSDVVAAARGDVAPALPLNRIPYMRAAIADKVVSSTDKITMDVIALLFDYIFRDPSIPEALRALFSRLQVPILKTALIDRSFFSNKKHPARRLLDHLAAASIGATNDPGYFVAFELIASGIVEEICRDFKVDMDVFENADARLQEFVDGEQKKLSATLDTEVGRALDAEKSEADRAHVRVFIRDKLAGVEVPFDVRAFSETVWADYLTSIRSREGSQSTAWQSAVNTLDDLLWSITAKERNAQKARLAKLVPVIIRNLRAGAAAVKVAAERVQPFLEAVYQLHMAAIKPRPAAAPAGAVASAPVAGPATPPPTAGKARPLPASRPVTPAPAASTATQTAAEPSVVPVVDPASVTPVVVAPAAPGAASLPTGNVHDFVNEMVVGTWLAFGVDDDVINARLSWVSPLRSKYIFTSRARTNAIVVSPEELAWQLGAGKARLVVEPVPLFDRAVSAALDTLAAARPKEAVAA